MCFSKKIILPCPVGSEFFLEALRRFYSFDKFLAEIKICESVTISIYTDKKSASTQLKTIKKTF
jgi:hypothetical protein